MESAYYVIQIILSIGMAFFYKEGIHPQNELPKRVQPLGKYNKI